MNRKTTAFIAAVLAMAAWFASLGLALGAGTPPVQQFVPLTIVGADGKPTAVIMLTPGPAANTWALIFNGTAVWQLSPIGDPTPVPPGPTPPPPPVPPVPPAPTLPEEAKTLALNAAQKLPAAGRQEDAEKLAAVYKAIAEQIPKHIDSIDKLILANRYAREIALGPQRAKVWEPWVKELGVWLDAKQAAGAIKTVGDCKPVWMAIGEGLAALKGGQRK